jgi:hypothetical protein
MARFDAVDFERLMGRIRGEWTQGQHTVVIGPTGCGKTSVLTRLLEARKYVLVFGTKLYDTTYERFIRSGYRRYSKYSDVPSWCDKAMLWPKIQPGVPLKEIYKIQADAFRPALNQIFHERGWTVVLDELHYICNELGLDAEAAMFHHQGRSSRLTMVDGFQRPANVPLVVYGSASHVFVWKTKQLDTDGKRLADFGGADRRELTENLMALEKHEFVYIDPVNLVPPVRSKMRL